MPYKQLTPLFLFCLIAIFLHKSTLAQDHFDWDSDLDYLARELPRVHKDFQLLMDTMEFRMALEELAQRKEELDTPQMVFEIQRILAGMKVSHTGIPFFYESRQLRVPFQLELFDDGLYMTGKPSGVNEYSERRIEAINGRPVDSVMHVLSNYLSYENTYWRDHLLPMVLIMPGLMEHAGTGESPDSIRYTLACGEERRTAANPQLGSMAMATRLQNQPWMRSGNRAYGYRMLNDTLLYIQYNRCRDVRRYHFSEFTGDVMEEIGKNPVTTVLLDLRLNQGGNSRVVEPLVEALKTLEGKRYFVAISRQTYSSGTFAARDFKEELGATLIGEPTGGSPHSYGENRSMTLPVSGIEVNYCVKYFDIMESEHPWIEPDIRLPYLAEDYFLGRDPVLELILKEGNSIH